MRTEEWITKLSEATAGDDEAFFAFRESVPLGLDEKGEIAVAHEEKKRGRSRHICVTGAKRTEFIKRLLVALACLYDETEACFFVLSPNLAYGELLALRHTNFVVPFVRAYEDCLSALETLKELLRASRSGERGYPKLILVLDGLETLVNDPTGTLDVYAPFFNEFARDEVEIVTGVDLLQSIFSGYPGAFVGIGNCLVTADEDGKADLTLTDEDSSLTAPKAFAYPDNALMESIAFLNSVSEAK